MFDAHLHPSGLTDDDLETLRYFGVEAALVPAGHTAASVDALFEHFDDLLNKQLARLERAGPRPYAARGVHLLALPRRRRARAQARARAARAPHRGGGGRIGLPGPRARGAPAREGRAVEGRRARRDVAERRAPARPRVTSFSRAPPSPPGPRRPREAASAS